MKAKIYIGIDPGTKTGLAVYDRQSKTFVQLATLSIHKAFDLVKQYHSESDIHVRIEDARKRKRFGDNAQAKIQGAGSIKRDCSAWEAFLKEYNISHEFKAPGTIKTKVSKLYFQQLTGYKGVTSNHARDAGMLVYGF